MPVSEPQWGPLRPGQRIREDLVSRNELCVFIHTRDLLIGLFGCWNIAHCPCWLSDKMRSVCSVRAVSNSLLQRQTWEVSGWHRGSSMDAFTGFFLIILIDSCSQRLPLTSRCFTFRTLKAHPLIILEVLCEIWTVECKNAVRRWEESQITHQPDEQSGQRDKTATLLLLSCHHELNIPFNSNTNADVSEKATKKKKNERKNHRYSQIKMPTGIISVFLTATGPKVVVGPCCNHTVNECVVQVVPPSTCLSRHQEEQLSFRLWSTRSHWNTGSVALSQHWD